MTQIHIDPALKNAIQNFQLPETLTFGNVMAPVMASCMYENGKWGDLELLPYGPITMYPTAKVLHYAQEIFEGMKAYRVNGNGPYIFRPDENHLRFNRSAERMAMPHVPHKIFNQAVFEVTAYSANFVPRRTGESLYLRPFMFAAEESLGIKPAEKFRFMVIASPSGSYFSGTVGGLSVYIERENARAFPGGTGFAKTGGNYAAGLAAAIKTKNLGFVQTLWLDARERKYIEEMSGMNVFVVINGELHTPKIGDTILDGITRKSIVQLARDLGYTVVERDIAIDDVLTQIKNGQCTEAFACGTAAIITPINYFGEADGERTPLHHPEGMISTKIREALLSIQEGRTTDTYKWVVPVEPKTL
ncbi:MAG: branched-chain amino acid aminotransferase [Bdellovibrionales bacterium]|nr:branched-chain amino acid aminotransferase [Bdellovibrionales bacterium]